jgi:hypothetical protein
MRSFVVAVSLLLLSFSAANAATTTKASLKGAYFFQVTQVQEVSWGKQVSKTCFGTTYTFYLGGQAASTKLTTGTVTFTGSGTFSMSATQYGQFDQTASNNTVSISCTSNPKEPYTTNSGSAVFDAPSTMTMTGPYTVASNQTGTMTVSGGESDEVVDLDLGQLNSSGVAGVVLISQPGKANGDYSTGVAILK